MLATSKDCMNFQKNFVILSVQIYEAIYQYYTSGSISEYFFVYTLVFLWFS